LKVLFDQGTPVPLRKALTEHTVSTAFEMGWAELANGELLDAAAAAFDVLITTDHNLRHQQNLSGRRLAILVLPTTSWPVIRNHTAEVADALAQVRAGDYRELTFSAV